MAEPDHDALAKAHMRSQVAHAAATQAALSRLWDETIDPNDLTRSFARFREKAVPYIGAGRVVSDRTAETYLRAIKEAAGLGPTVALPASNARLDEGVIKSSLSAATGRSLARADALQRKGHSPAEALAAAKSNMLGSSKRQIINASRTRVIESTRRDKELGRWARVSDGKPCQFCAMLVSRGPVYSALSAHFAAHDRCGCNARPVTANDPTGGWSEEARLYRDAWDADQRTSMRRWYEERELDVPERFLPRPGELSFAILTARTTDKVTARRKASHGSPDNRGGASRVSPSAGANGDARGARATTSDRLDGRGTRGGDPDRLVIGGHPATALRASPPPPRTFELNARGVETVPILELDPATSAMAFREALAAAKASNGKMGSSVTVYDDYSGMRLFTTEDGLSGFALHDGDIVSVFSHGDQPVRGIARTLLAHAVAEGGNRLDAFETYLPRIYAREGFVPVARLPFDDEYAPDGWDYPAYADYNDGRPDVVFFRYDPAHLDSEYNPSDAVPVTSYEDGQALQTP
ncbi:minor capsid protein [Microbacterium phage UtzChips]|nr:minor capsid protein [Microbacterium phage UtzChips]